MNSLKLRRPFALLVKKDTFSPYEQMKKNLTSSCLSRENAIKEIIGLSRAKDLIFCTTGKASRELYEIRVNLGENIRDFLTVGSMGHTSSIALGAALGRKDLRIICIDGDGAMLMHMGGIAIIGDLAPDQYIHVVLNNSAHESVGGQKTVAGNMDLKKLSESCQYSYYGRADDIDSLKSEWKKLEEYKGPVMIEILISTEVRNNLGRPKSSAKSNKEAFMNFVKEVD
jgi:phosphonopyruvate decarboxylase